jgi:hypothetical protein
LRIEYADTAQIGSALKSADQFGAMVKDPEKANNFVKAFNASTPAQQEARLASIGDWMLSKLRGGGEDAPARMAELQSAGVLETLDRLGQKGKALADDIRAIRDEEMDLQTFFPKSESQSISNAVALAEGPQVYSRPGASSLPVNALADAALMGAGVASAPIMTAMRQGPRLYRGIMQPRTATREDMTRVLVARPRGPTRPPATQQALPAGPANALNPPSPVPAGPPVNPLTPPRRPPEQSGFGGSQPRRFETPEQADAEYARLAAQLDEKRVELFTANRKRSEAYEGEQRTKLEATYKAREKEIAAKMPAWEKQFMEKNAGRYDEDVLADRADDYAYAMYNRETAKLDKWRDSQEDLISDRGYKFMDRLDAKVEKWYDAQYEQLADSFDDTDFGGMVRANSAGIGGVGGAVGGYIANPVDANGDGVIDDADRPLNAMGGLVSGVVGGKLAGAGANKLLGPRRGAAAGRFRAPSQQTFGGVNAKTADKAALARAQNMEAEGASRDAIWDETGWFKGVDGKWRFEIDDSGAKLGPKTVEELTSGGDHGGSQRTLAGALHHKELYDAYPQLRNAEADIRVNSKFAKPNGAWVADNEGIRGGRNLARVETNSLEDARSILLHEAAGHGVQDIEGFARGGAMTDDLLPSDMAAHNHDQLVKRSRDIMAMPHVIAAQKRLDELKAQWQGRSEIPADVVEELKAIQAMPEKKELARIRAEATGQLRKAEEWGVKNLFTRDQLFDGYRRLAGEVEARNLQTRDAMRLRGEQPGAPWTTQDVPDDQQIVRFGSGRAESRGAAPKAGPQKPPAQSGFGGGAAAPDVAAHVAMAKEQGFNTDKVYYHGAAKQFEQFDMSKVGQREIPWYGKGAYLSPDKEVARRYATSDQNVMPFFVRGKLLKVDKDSPPPEWLKNSRDWSATLTERGYSGLEIGGKIPELVVFNPSDLIRATPPKAVSPDAVRYTAKPAPWDKTGKSWVVMDAETGTDTGGVMSKAFAEDLVRSLQKPKR